METDIFDSDYYKLNKKLLVAVGLWPYQQTTNIAIAIFGLAGYCIPQGLLGSLPTIVSTFLLISKIIVVHANSTELKILLSRMNDDWRSSRTRMEKKILSKYAANGRKITAGYSFAIAIPITLYMCYPLAAPILDFLCPLNESRARSFMYPAEYLIDHEKYFYFILIGNYIAYLSVVIILVGCDAIYFVIMEHVCGMFTLLSYYLENVSPLDDRPRKIKASVRQPVYRTVVACIQLHVRLKEFAACIGRMFQYFLLFDIGIGIIIVSGACVMSIVSADRPIMRLKFCAVAVAQSFRLFLTSFPGQRLMDHSAEVYNAAYNTGWYETPARLRNLLLPLMMQSQVPCVLSIANLYDVNLDSFGMVMRTSLSYCTLMLSLYDRSNY